MVLALDSRSGYLSRSFDPEIDHKNGRMVHMVREEREMPDDSADDLIGQAGARELSQEELSPGPPVIEASRADHVFASGAGVKNLSFQVPRGVIFGLVGPSGSGKTTTIRLLNGMYRPDQGSIRVLGQPPDRFNSTAKESIGYMPQNFVLYPMLTVWENLNFVASLYGLGFFGRHKRLRQLLTFTELYDARNRLASQLSGGMQRRLQLACALVHEPQLVFIDEPTAGIDPILRSKFWDHFRALRDDGRTLFVTTQYISEIEYCDLVGIMRDGQMVYIDTPDGLRRQAYGGDLLRVVVRPDDAVEAVNLLNSQSIVTDARRSFRQPGLLLISTDDAATAMPELLNVLENRNIAIQQADKYIPPFDDVFVELMKQAGDGND